MAFARRTCLLLALAFVSVFAGLQGVGASYAVSGGGDPAAGISASPDALFQDTVPARAENTDDPAPPVETSPVRYSATQWPLERIRLAAAWSAGTVRRAGCGAGYRHRHDLKTSPAVLPEILFR
jgi:hypothetical protein